MKWHYLKDEDYPKWYSDIIVKCEDGDGLKTGCSSYDDDILYNHKPFAASFYDDDGFNAEMGSLTWVNVVAWCYIEDVYEELQKQEIKGE